MSLPSHILVIRLSALGDIAMTVPVLRVMAKNYPGTKLTVLSRNYAQPLFSDIPGIGFLGADLKGEHKGFGLLKLASDAKALGIDAVADLHDVIRTKVIRNYLSIAGLQTAVIDKGRAEKKLLSSGDDKWFKQLKTTHQRYADVFTDLGFTLDLSEHEFPEPAPVTPRLNSLMGTAPKKAIGIAPFAAYKSKMYPLEQTKEVISLLDASDDYKIFLFGGGKKEIDQLKKLESEFQSVTNIAGQLTLSEELALISNLDLMLSMDSSNGHLATMYGVPVVTLWGVTHPYAGFAPFNQDAANHLMADRKQYPEIPTSVYGNRFPESYEDAMKTIPAGKVVDKILSLL